jgi:hypothetical protein
VIFAYARIDEDTLFLFNYRSDRMREISTVLGALDKPVDVELPKDLVRAVLGFRLLKSEYMRVAYNFHVALQCRIPIPGSLPSTGDDERPCGMARKARGQASAHRRSVVVAHAPSSQSTDYRIQRRRNTRT